MGKNIGLFKKYEVKKLSNPEKELDCVVLEFDDPIARQALEFWAELMRKNGYSEVHKDTIEKLWQYRNHP